MTTAAEGFSPPPLLYSVNDFILDAAHSIAHGLRAAMQLLPVAFVVGFQATKIGRAVSRTSDIYICNMFL